MFDIEKAKSKGLCRMQIEIMQKINENTSKRESCKRHDFEDGSRPGRFRCKNCGCEQGTEFVLGYTQGLKQERERILSELKAAKTLQVKGQLDSCMDVWRKDVVMSVVTDDTWNFGG